MYEILETNLYRKEIKLMIKRGKSTKKIYEVVKTLVDNANNCIEHHLLLPTKYKLHKLSGQYNKYWECHIEPDWLLFYYIDDKVLRLERTGTHSDIF